MTPPLTYDRPFANRTLSRRDPQTTGELVQTTDLVGASRKRVNQVMATYKNLKLIASRLGHAFRGERWAQPPHGIHSRECVNQARYI